MNSNFFFLLFYKKKEKKRHNLSMAFTGQLVFVVSEASGLEPPMVTGNQYVLFPSIISPLRKKECVYRERVELKVTCQI